MGIKNPQIWWRQQRTLNTFCYLTRFFLQKPQKTTRKTTTWYLWEPKRRILQKKKNYAKMLNLEDAKNSWRQNTCNSSPNERISNPLILTADSCPSTNWIFLLLQLINLSKTVLLVRMKTRADKFLKCNKPANLENPNPSKL